MYFSLADSLCSINTNHFSCNLSKCGLRFLEIGTQTVRLAPSPALSSLSPSPTTIPSVSPDPHKAHFPKPAVDTEGAGARSLEAPGFLHHSEHVVGIARDPSVWPGHILQLVHRAGFLKHRK